MKTTTKRFASAFLLLCMLVSMFSVSASATTNPSTGEGDGNRSSAYLDSYVAALIPKAGGKIGVCVDVTAVINATQLGAKDIYLYESTDGSNFSQVKHYNYTNYPTMMGSGASYYRTPVTYSGTAGRYYFASVYVYAGDSTGGDTRCYTTAVYQAHS